MERAASTDHAEELPEMAVSAALESLGVRGPNLPKLVEAGVSLEMIRSEVENIRQDRHVRNVPAVLVPRLATRLGIKLSSRSKLDPQSLAALATIENYRRFAHKTRATALDVASVLNGLSAEKTHGQARSENREAG